MRVYEIKNWDKGKKIRRKCWSIGEYIIIENTTYPTKIIWNDGEISKLSENIDNALLYDDDWELYIEAPKHFVVKEFKKCLDKFDENLPVMILNNNIIFNVREENIKKVEMSRFLDGVWELKKEFDKRAIKGATKTETKVALIIE